MSNGGATYGPAGELLTFNGVTRTYNALGQLTRMTKSGVMDMEYRYTAGQNNGRIYQSKDYVTGEEVTYQYDALNRLTRAQTTDSAWGNAYTYDGWGNLTGKSVTKGTAPTLSMNYDPALNMPVGSQPPTAGFPGNRDLEDRPRDGKSEVARDPYSRPYSGELSWDPSNRKIFWKRMPNQDMCELYFYSITGQRLARYSCEYAQTSEENEEFRVHLRSALESNLLPPLDVTAADPAPDRTLWPGDTV